MLHVAAALPLLDRSIFPLEEMVAVIAQWGCTPRELLCALRDAPLYLPHILTQQEPHSDTLPITELDRSVLTMRSWDRHSINHLTRLVPRLVERIRLHRYGTRSGAMMKVVTFLPTIIRKARLAERTPIVLHTDPELHFQDCVREGLPKWSWVNRYFLSDAFHLPKGRKWSTNLYLQDVGMLPYTAILNACGRRSVNNLRVFLYLRRQYFNNPLPYPVGTVHPVLLDSERNRCIPCMREAGGHPFLDLLPLHSLPDNLRIIQN